MKEEIFALIVPLHYRPPTLLKAERLVVESNSHYGSSQPEKQRIESHKEKTMKKTYTMEVDCANCANLMEEAANKTAGVEKASVNFMMQKMTVQFTDGYHPQEVMEEVLKACKKIEPDCTIHY